MMFSGVKSEDILPLAGSRIDCAQVFPSLHFPDGCYYSVFLHSVIRNFLSAGSSRPFAAGFARHGCVVGRAFIFRHTKSGDLLSKLFHGGWIFRIVAYGKAGV